MLIIFNAHELNEQKHPCVSYVDLRSMLTTTRHGWSLWQSSDLHMYRNNFTSYLLQYLFLFFLYR